ncbi:MAG TPA: lipoyl synthase [Lacipirellulaceae bacterium]|nr:lipoyl synthase [Lacipirellulaceae bacterium]
MNCRDFDKLRALVTAPRASSSLSPSPPTTDPASSARPRLPEWLRVNLPAGPRLAVLNSTHNAVANHGLHTVCEEARCPNLNDCWSRGTATFMVAGKECTRGCRFCSVETLRSPAPPDANEPEQLAAAVERMGLAHVVITVVNRDDLADGGASHYKGCVEEVHERLPAVTIELLSSDLGGDEDALAYLLDGVPLAVFAHNVECVPRLDCLVRDPRASFARSLNVLRRAKEWRPDLWTKSSIMIGLGETDEEVSDAMRQLRDAGVDILTLGQYLSPGRHGERYLPVVRFAPPERFTAWAEEAKMLGFRAVASGPLVRSSYRAGLLLEEARRYLQHHSK